MPTRHVRGVVALSMAALLLTGCQRPVDFPVTRATTFLTEPLREDGTVDYAAAWNAEYSLPAASNAAVLLSVVFQYELSQQASERMGRQAAPDPDLPVFVGGDPGLWDSYRAWREDRALALPPDFETLTRQLTQATRRPWRAAEFPALSAWLTDMGPALAEIERASHLDGHWMPASDPLRETPTPRLLQIRSAANALQARAMNRLDEANPAAALLDLRTMIRLGHLVSDRGSLISALIGMAIRSMALEALPRVAVHPDLGVDDLVAAQEDLRIDAFVEHYVVALNTERLGFLPMITTPAITGRFELRPGEVSGEITDRVPWTQIATDYNRHWDLLIESIRAQTHEERLASEQAAESVMDALVAGADESMASRFLQILTRRSSATEQIIQIIMNIGRPGIGRANLSAADTRTLAELSALYLDLMISRKQSGSYPSSIETDDREGPTHRMAYTPTDERPTTGFALTATPIDAESRARSFCLDATGAFVEARGSDTLLAVEGRCQQSSD